MKFLFGFILCVLWVVPLRAEDAPAVEDAPVLVSEILNSIRDPFLSQLPPPPPPPIIETPNGGETPPSPVDPLMGPGGVRNNAAVVEVVKPALEIQGIVYGDDIKQAIINGHVVQVGEIINGATIKEISQSGIKVIFSGKQFSYTVD